MQMLHSVNSDLKVQQNLWLFCLDQGQSLILFCNATALRTGVLETEEGKLGFRCLTGKPRLSGNSRELLAQRAQRIRMDPQKGIWDPILVGIGEFIT